MVRTLFIVNPKAGRGAALQAWKRIEKHVAGKPEIEAVIPPSYEATRSAAAEAARTGIERVVALGGDGTLDAIAGELAHSDTSLGVIPSGTGNDFGKTNGISLDPEAALPIALGTHTRRVDLGLAAKERHFLNVAGAGFDAQVSSVVLQYPKGLGGTLPYLMGAITTIFRYQAVPVTITVDDQQYEGPITLVAVANGSQYGGGMRIAPSARRDDGVFDVCIADQLSRAELFGLLPRVYTGSHVNHPKIHFLSGRHVQIQARGPIHAHADGDLLKSTDLTFETLVGALNVAVPARVGR
ncbi:MAG: diacylglycerol/lipid kinase family protein [Mycobacterium leprae]